MYSVWFQDLEKVIQVMKEKVPTMETFNEIRGNAFGDFIIQDDTNTYIVKHTDFSVWHLSNWKSKESWEEIK